MTKASPAVTALLASNLFLVGLASAAILPYRAVVAIEGLGFSNQAFAAAMIVNAAATAVLSVVLGGLSDRMGDRRKLVLLSAVTGFVAYLLVWLVQTALAYLLAFCVILPLGGALMSQSLAFSRAYYDRTAPDRAVYMTSVMRTMFSAAWVVVPPLAGFVAARFSVLDVFAFAALGHLGCSLIFLALFLRPDAHLPPAPVTTGGTWAFWKMLSLGQTVGITGVYFLRTAILLHAQVLPLAMVNDFNGTYQDLGLTSALAAFLEVPLMILWGRLAGKLPLDAILIGNGVLFAAYTLAVSQAGTPGLVLWLQLPNAVATAALISMTITYMQSTIKGRVGLSTSLFDLVNVASAVTGSALFGVLTGQASYAVGFIATAIAALAGSALLILARRFPAG